MIEVRAEMESSINDICCIEGSYVRVGDTILRLDCMKMMIPVYAPADGYVYYHAELGAYIQTGELLATVDDK